ncbi:uncharacterized protein EMH_0015770 [Eimeria mitis]|uniref:SAG family member n=1 Tax=Eimeria mitis TaxID=44415 RepID=U6KAZ3_9EIME|nr:uncharacterized protein EMH_0015770 [Eimeria mitis]CDJ33367.1 hypothetical protein, conserved [Eimeria mitis]
MAIKGLVVVAFAAALAVRAEPEAPSRCPNGEVRFEGRATFEESDRPETLSKDAVLTIDVSEEAASGEEPKTPIYTHTVPLESYTPDAEIPYAFCVDLQNLDAKKISLKARVSDPEAEAKVECIGETVVTAGSDTYEADLTLAKVDGATSSSNEPSVADCNFAQLSDDVTGVAVKATVQIGAPRTLPKPTYLVVTLRETDSETGEPEVISLFSGDISGIYEPERPVPAFLCAKVSTNADEHPKYTLEASVHLGWDGYAHPNDDERSLRKGDLVTRKPIEVPITPDQHDYTVNVTVKPYNPSA